jgi:hypothetical protein
MLGLSVVLFDSDLRLEVLLHEQQGVRQIGTATVSEIVSKPTQATTHYSAVLHDSWLTAHQRIVPHHCRNAR